MDYVLTTSALTKQYRSFKALNGVNMHVPKGAIYGIIGKNGAGKTTFIRLICGLQAPTAGEYRLYGQPHTAKEISKARRRMGAIVETPSTYLDMTAEDNIRQQYQILGLPSYKGIPELLRLVNLENTGKKRRSTSRLACASGWALLLPWRVTQTCWCWMSLSMGWTRRALLRYAS